MGKHNQVGEKLLQKNKSIIKKVKTSLNFMITEHLFLSQNNVNNDTMEQSLSIYFHWTFPLTRIIEISHKLSESQTLCLIQLRPF